MKLHKVTYRELNSKQREVFNYQKVAGNLADYGFNCIKLADDWQGADFLAYHKDGNSTLKVQLESRVTVSKKYLKKSLFMAFPIAGAWYVIEHDKLVAMLKIHTTWLTTESWRKRGSYSSTSPNQALVKALAAWKL